MRFTNKVAVVTGAASGIGLATAKRLGSEGARVVIADVNQEKAHAAAEAVKAAGAPDAWASACDVSQAPQVEATVKGAVQRFGQLDVVVNNAGLMVFKPLEKHTEEDWLRILRVDLLGAFFFTQQAFMTMKPGGAIVNVSSIHAEETTPQVASYAAAKAALLSLTRSASIEGKPKGIRVNAILPGAVDTPMLRAGLGRGHVGQGDVQERLDNLARKTVSGKVGKPEEIASAIYFLADDAQSSFMTGQALVVDGGATARLSTE